MKRFMIALLCVLLSVHTVFAQGVDDVTLTTTGVAETEQDAVLNALRSAIEQVYGTFVSANTTILNDELVKDEIVSVSKGNIKSYEKLAVTESKTGQIMATVRAVVSVSQLASFAKSKGSSAEFAGQTFALNMKLMQLKKSNTETVLNHTFEQVDNLLNDAFDYEVSLKDPIIATRTYNGNNSTKTDGYMVEATVSLLANDTARAIYLLLYETLNSLALSQEEIESAEKLKMSVDSWKIGGGRHPVTQIYLPCDISSRMKNLYQQIADASFNYSIDVVGADTYQWVPRSNVRLKFAVITPNQSLSCNDGDEYGKWALCSKTDAILYSGINPGTRVFSSSIFGSPYRVMILEEEKSFLPVDWFIFDSPVGKKTRQWDHPAYITDAGSLGRIAKILNEKGKKNKFYSEDIAKAFDELSQKEKDALIKKWVPKGIQKQIKEEGKEVNGTAFVAFLPLQQEDRLLFSYPIDIFITQEEMAKFGGISIHKD